jgi:hypothetical protein
MDLRAYYRKLRATEAAMPSPHAVMVSLATPDGGVPGVVTEVPTAIAARMVIEGSGRQATPSEASEFHERQAAARQAVEDAAAVNRLQVVVLPASQPPTKISGRGGKEQ